MAQTDKQKKVLIVEDERPLVRALELKLKTAGFLTKGVFDGAQALEELKQEKYDLILLDLVMPNTDGFAVLEELQSRKNHTPIIVTSNLGQEEDFNRAKKLGAKDYFIKSNTSLAELVKQIQTHLK